MSGTVPEGAKRSNCEPTAQLEGLGSCTKKKKKRIKKIKKIRRANESFFGRRKKETHVLGERKCC